MWKGKAKEEKISHKEIKMKAVAIRGLNGSGTEVNSNVRYKCMSCARKDPAIKGMIDQLDQLKKLKWFRIL